MKQPLAVVSYLLFIVLFVVLLVPFVSFVTTKYLLFLVGLYFLFQNAIGEKTPDFLQVYNFLFIGATIAFVIYATRFSSSLLSSIVSFFLVASIVGLVIALVAGSKQRLPRPVLPRKSTVIVQPRAAEPNVVVAKSSKNISTVKVSKSVDDLSKIEGIGPAIKRLLSRAGIKTFKQLSVTKVADLRAILANGGEKYVLHNPSTWPRQARLAAAGKWIDLGKLQDKLDGGLVKTKRVKSGRSKVVGASKKKSVKKSVKKSSRKSASRRSKR